MNNYQPIAETPNIKTHYGVHVILFAFTGFILLLAVFLGSIMDNEGLSQPSINEFPSDFMWATATASYQIEGASSEDGRGVSTWDAIRAEKGRIRDGSDVEQSCEGYKKWKEDIELLKKLGVTHYRFSLSWTRIFPNGTKESKNQNGIQHYRRLCEELIANNIQPIAVVHIIKLSIISVTLYHADYSLDLYNKGGWMVEESIQWYTDFATCAFEELGDLVKLWITFNEIPMHAWAGVIKFGGQPFHSLDIDPKEFNLERRQVPYKVAHHMILAHAEAYHIYKKQFWREQRGEVGLVSGGRWAIPAMEDPEYRSAARRAFAWNFRWIVEPVYGNGNYPQEMVDRLRELEDSEGIPILPTFTEKQKKKVKGSADFLAINYYTTDVTGPPLEDSQLIEDDEKDWTVDSLLEYDAQFDYYNDTFFRISGDTWLRLAPEGLADLLHHIKIEYNNVPVLISENGCADMVPINDDDPLEDINRVRYIRDHIETIGKAITDGCNVIGYTAWSLMDNFEWDDGFAMRFGLFRVDFNKPNKPRTAKRSAMYYKRIIERAKEIHTKQ